MEVLCRFPNRLIFYRSTRRIAISTGPGTVVGGTAVKSVAVPLGARRRRIQRRLRYTLARVRYASQARPRATAPTGCGRTAFGRNRGSQT